MTSAQKGQADAKATEAGPRRIDLNVILRGDREVIIAHGADEYRLRLTSNDKLLLTK